MDTTPLGEQTLIDGLKHMVITPVNLRSTFLLLTRLHYSNPENYGPVIEAFKKFVWNKDKAKSTLNIDPSFLYDPKEVDRLPAIFVDAADITYDRKAVDNYKAATDNRAGQTYVKVGHCTIRLMHISASPDEASQLGYLSATFFDGIRPMMQSQAGFRSYDVVMLTSAKPVKSGDDKARNKQFSVDVIINIEFNAVWTSLIESHPVKTFVIKQALAELSDDKL